MKNAAAHMNTLELIFEALQEANSQRAPERQLVCEPEAVLFGQEGQMDSLELVNFIVDLEALISERTGRDVTLADEKALSRSRSPFRTAAALAEYVEGLLATHE